MAAIASVATVCPTLPALRPRAQRRARVAGKAVSSRTVVACKLSNKQIFLVVHLVRLTASLESSMIELVLDRSENVAGLAIRTGRCPAAPECNGPLALQCCRLRSVAAPKVEATAAFAAASMAVAAPAGATEVRLFSLVTFRRQDWPPSRYAGVGTRN
eukprot:scaffold906_cov395-Prasinococcus_capsulatus_cf.AAC.5